MKSLIDREGALTRGLADIRTQFGVPASFPENVLAEANTVAARPISQHAEWTAKDFATLDPRESTDLDQAFCIESSGADLILHYAIADVGWFIDVNSPLDIEAWKRGTTIYMPDGKASLYPPQLSEGAASLLPGVDRPSVVFSVRIDSSGSPSLDGAVKAVIRSRAKLAYETVRPEDLPSGFTELARRIDQAETHAGQCGSTHPSRSSQSTATGSSGSSSDPSYRLRRRMPPCRSLPTSRLPTRSLPTAPAFSV